ncbi:MAG: hypothetical protein R3C49_12725 [Planctomycetaceae bacterium]
MGIPSNPTVGWHEREATEEPLASALKLYREARALIHECRLEAAENCLAEAQKLVPDLSEAWGAMAAIEQARDNFTKAIELAEKSIAIDSGYSRAWSVRAASLMCTGQFEEAGRCAEEVVRLTPEFGDGWVILSCIQLNLGEMEASSQSLAQAERCDPGGFGVLLQKAELAERQNRPKEAERFLCQAEDSVKTTYEAGRLLLKQAERALGRDELDTAKRLASQLKLNPVFEATAWSILSRTVCGDDRHVLTDGLHAVVQWTRLAPATADAHHLECVFRTIFGEQHCSGPAVTRMYRLATAAADRAIELSPDVADYHQSRADVLFNLARYLQIGNLPSLGTVIKRVLLPHAHRLEVQALYNASVDDYTTALNLYRQQERSEEQWESVVEVLRCRAYSLIGAHRSVEALEDVDELRRLTGDSTALADLRDKLIQHRRW